TQEEQTLRGASAPSLRRRLVRDATVPTELGLRPSVTYKRASHQGGFMVFVKLKYWGYVNPRTILTDREGNRYVVQEERGGVIQLRNLSGRDHLAFKPLDEIDHVRFQAE